MERAMEMMEQSLVVRLAPTKTTLFASVSRLAPGGINSNLIIIYTTVFKCYCRATECISDTIQNLPFSFYDFWDVYWLKLPPALSVSWMTVVCTFSARSWCMSLPPKTNERKSKVKIPPKGSNGKVDAESAGNENAMAEDCGECASHERRRGQTKRAYRWAPFRCVCV